MVQAYFSDGTFFCSIDLEDLGRIIQTCTVHPQLALRPTHAQSSVIRLGSLPSLYLPTSRGQRESSEASHTEVLLSIFSSQISVYTTHSRSSTIEFSTEIKIAKSLWDFRYRYLAACKTHFFYPNRALPWSTDHIVDFD